MPEGNRRLSAAIPPWPVGSLPSFAPRLGCQNKPVHDLLALFPHRGADFSRRMPGVSPRRKLLNPRLPSGIPPGCLNPACDHCPIPLKTAKNQLWSRNLFNAEVLIHLPAKSPFSDSLSMAQLITHDGGHGLEWAHAKASWRRSRSDFLLQKHPLMK